MSRPPVPIRIYAHRGSPAEEPENTLASFHRALTEGANALELDVHLTRDGTFVVSHDPDGRRTAGVDRLIRDLTLEEVKRWDVGPGDGTSGRSSVPTLEEVLHRFPGVPMSVDFKPDAPEAAPDLIALLSRHAAVDMVTVGSFHTRVTRAVRRGGYAGPTALTRPEVALLLVPLPTFLLRCLIAGTAALVPPVSGLVRLDTPAFIGRCRRLGLRVDYWVVNDVDTALELTGRGATGIITDHPSRMVAALRQFLRDTSDT